MRKRIATFFVFLSCCGVELKAQNWGGGIDDKIYSFGFHFEGITTEYKILKNENWQAPYYDATALGNKGAYVTDKLAAISSPQSIGYGLGGLFKLQLAKHFDFRFAPALAFINRKVIYDYLPPLVNNPQNPSVAKDIKVSLLEFPLDIKLKSDRIYNARVYLIAGIKYSMDITSQHHQNDENALPVDKFLKNQKTFFSYQGGVGFEFYFEYFKISPELKLSYSLNDILQHDHTPYAMPIKQLMLRSLSFSIFLE